MKIDVNSPEHAYLQLAAYLRKQIDSGEITAKLPSLTELAAETHLAVGTIRRAVDGWPVSVSCKRCQAAGRS